MPTGHARTAAGTGLALAMFGCALGASALVVILSGSTPDNRAISIAVHALGIGLPVGLGLFRLSVRRDDRFAALLVAVGLLWALTALAESNNGVLYSLGRVAAWSAELALVYLMLAFPSGRLRTTSERVLGGAAAALFVVLYLPTALLAQGYPEPSPWATCGTDCPANAFSLANPAWVHDVVRPLRETLTVLLFAAVAAALLQRTRRADPAARRMVRPVAAIALFRVVALAVYSWARAADAASSATEVLGWIYLLSLPAVTVCFGAGLLEQRLFVASALQRLSVGLAPHARAAEVRAALADALEDPSLRIVYWLGGDPGRWVDETGWPVKLPEDQPDRAITEVTADGRRLAAIVHGTGLSKDPTLVRAAGSHALAALENDRLIGELRSSLRDLAESRARIVAVADRERQKIERDLHDGAQQRLVALRIKLELVAESLDGLSGDRASAIRRLEDDVDATIDEIRSFARGIYPSLLADRGLEPALRAAARGAALPAAVDVDGIGRYPPEIEATVYFACTEALQNAVKHGRGATGVTIAVSQDDRLRFEVRDDGAGFDQSGSPYGTGLTNIHDRLAAVGGELTIESESGSGTHVTGSVPTGQRKAVAHSAS